MSRGLLNMMAFGYQAWAKPALYSHSWFYDYKTSCVMRFFIFENNERSCHAVSLGYMSWRIFLFFLLSYSIFPCLYLSLILLFSQFTDSVSQTQAYTTLSHCTGLKQSLNPKLHVLTTTTHREDTSSLV